MSSGQPFKIEGTQFAWTGVGRGRPIARHCFSSHAASPRSVNGTVVTGSSASSTRSASGLSGAATGSASSPSLVCTMSSVASSSTTTCFLKAAFVLLELIVSRKCATEHVFRLFFHVSSLLPPPSLYSALLPTGACIVMLVFTILCVACAAQSLISTPQQLLVARDKLEERCSLSCRLSYSACTAITYRSCSLRDCAFRLCELSSPSQQSHCAHTSCSSGRLQSSALTIQKTTKSTKPQNPSMAIGVELWFLLLIAWVRFFAHHLCLLASKLEHDLLRFDSELLVC